MPNYYDDPTLQNAQNEAQAAGTTAVAYQSAASQLPAKLKEAVMGKLDYNKDLIEQKNKAQADYFAAPSAAREQYQDIWNPFEREKLVAGERAQAYGSYANTSDILNARVGSVADIINAGTGSFNSAVTAQQGAAGLANQKYSDLLNMAQLQEGKQQQEWENLMRMAEFNKPSGNKGDEDRLTTEDIIRLLTGQDGLQGGTIGTEPNYSPAQGVGSTSEDGQWLYTGGGKMGWEPRYELVQ